MFAVPAPPPPSRVYVRVQIVDGIRTLIVTGSSRDRGAGRKTKEESGSRLVLSVGLDAIHVSVYDATPSELLCLSLRELEVRVDTLAEEERQTTVQVNVGDLQLDDQSIRPSNEVIIHPKMAFLTRREREALASAGAAGGGRGQRPSGGGRRSADGGGDTLHLGEGARFLSVAMSMYQWEADSGGTPTLFLKKFKVKILPLVITVGDDIVNTLIACVCALLHFPEPCAPVPVVPLPAHASLSFSAASSFFSAFSFPLPTATERPSAAFLRARAATRRKRSTTVRCTNWSSASFCSPPPPPRAPPRR
jgi:hypothetical protein